MMTIVVYILEAGIASRKKPLGKKKKKLGTTWGPLKIIVTQGLKSPSLNKHYHPLLKNMLQSM